MTKFKILPKNKGYAALFACILVVAVVFVPKGIQEYIALAEFIETGDWVVGEDGKSLQRNGGTTRRGKPIIEKDGKTLVWAGGNPGSETAKWFDMTDATIDPTKLDHGIGADRIPSIDEPAFMSKGDPEFDENISSDSSQRVIGVFAEGEARAYPISIMNRHELVNDTFGDTHLTVAW